MEKIDFVLPWVDSEDLDWQRDRLHYSKKSINTSSNHIARFRDFGTLKYVLRAIEQNVPWYNRVFLITHGHYPKWLNINHPKIELITHKELYFKKEHLPTFNSASIEMNLANLKSLSDKFIYLNDDTFIFNRVEKDRFFRDGKPVDFLSHSPIPRNRLFKLLRGGDSWVDTLNNALGLINREFAPMEFDRKFLYDRSYSLKIRVNNFMLERLFKRFIWLEHWHHPQPYLKKTILEVFENFKEHMLKASENRFRDSTDLTPYIYRYWHLAKMEFYPKRYNDGFDADIKSFEDLQKIIIELSQKGDRFKFVCFNDQMYSVDFKEFIDSKMLLEEFLEDKFPQRASFEI